MYLFRLSFHAISYHLFRFLWSNQCLFGCLLFTFYLLSTSFSVFASFCRVFPFSSMFSIFFSSQRFFTNVWSYPHLWTLPSRALHSCVTLQILCPVCVFVTWAGEPKETIRSTFFKYGAAVPEIKLSSTRGIFSRCARCAAYILWEFIPNMCS